DVDHALALVRIAFAAGGDARAASDAARGIKKYPLYQVRHCFSSSSAVSDWLEHAPSATHAASDWPQVGPGDQHHAPMLADAPLVLLRQRRPCTPGFSASAPGLDWSAGSRPGLLHNDTG